MEIDFSDILNKEGFFFGQYVSLSEGKLKMLV
jgi:hypothetical protein